MRKQSFFLFLFARAASAGRLLLLIFLSAWTASAAPPPQAAPFKEKPLVVTYFFYWYCDRTREHFLNPDGSDALTDHPLQPKGYSYRSSEWWRKELLEVKAAGIDAVLPVYWGVPGVEKSFSKIGLKHLAEAWDALSREGKSPPRVGMFYDTSTLAWNPARKRIDISTESGVRFFTRTVIEFFSLVPRRTWLLRRRRPVVFLYGAGFHRGDNPRLFDRLRESFRTAFGTDLFLVAEVSWPYPADAVYSWGGALGLRLYDVAALGPGYDHSAVPGRKPLFVDRRDGDFYRRNWELVLALNPKTRPRIVAVETWNEFHEGTDIAPSKEYGRKYVELTAHYAELFHRGVRLSIKGPWSGRPYVEWKNGEPAGLKIPSFGDGLVEKRKLRGRTSMRTVPNTHGPGRFIYADVAESFAFDPPSGRFLVTVTVSLERKSRLLLEYDSRDRKGSVHAGAFKALPPTPPLESGAWHTVDFKIEDARFINRANGADFRLSAEGNDFAVSRIRVSVVPH